MSKASNRNQSESSFDARQMSEDIATGEQQVPKVDVTHDYEAAKTFSTSPVDQQGEGQELAEAVTAPEHEIRDSKVSVSSPEAASDPAAFQAMAREVNPRTGAEHPDPESLVEKAIEKGQPSK